MTFLLSTIIRSDSTGQTSWTLISTQTDYEAGVPVVLEFSGSNNTPSLVYINSSYGSTLLNPTTGGNTHRFSIPAVIATKRGTIFWNLIKGSAVMSGILNIHPQKTVETMESYLGPPSIEAGGTDYSMLVVIPTDSLGNAVADGTEVRVKHQFLNSEDEELVLTDNLIAYKNIFSQKQTGRILLASECGGINSKEYDINVMPAIPTSFTISAERPHSYADGNQITTFITSAIKDKYGNIVSDGTYVSYFITTSQGAVLQSSGTTINGVARAKMIHPDAENQWTVMAYVDGMAESNAITIRYEQVIKEVVVIFSENNRNIVVGPLQSFMSQIIPDGLPVKLTVVKDGKPLETLTGTSKNGYVRFYLKSDVYKNDSYDISIQTAGMTKEYNTLNLW